MSHLVSDHLRAVTQESEIHEQDYLTFRLGALLHDIGHLPFSHILEVASAEICARHQVDACHHEELGEDIINSDATIVSALTNMEITAKDVSNVFRRLDRRNHLSNLLSADFDVDRLDYMLRTAHATGLPYGKADVSYLISQLRYKSSGAHKIYLTRKALRAAEHFLLGRFFEYQQVAFHKTVKGLELLLKDLTILLGERELIDLSKKGVLALISSGLWETFDDEYIFALIREHFLHDGDALVRAKAESLVRRIPPRVITSFETIMDRKVVGDQFEKCERLVNEYAQENAIDGRLKCFHTKLDITKILPPGQGTDPQSIGATANDKVDQLIYIESNLPRGSGSQPETVDLARVSNSLINLLASKSWVCFRVYGVDLNADLHRSNLREIVRRVFGEIDPDGVR